MKGAGKFADYIGGALGYVTELLIAQSAVSVQLLNGITLHEVGVPSKEWVCNTTNANGDTVSTGGIDLPPKGTLVFVMFPYGINTQAGAMVLFSIFEADDAKQAAFLSSDYENQRRIYREGGIITTYDRSAKSFEVTDADNTDFSILLDKANKKLAIVDWSGNEIEIDSDGITVEDANSNSVAMASGGITVGDKSGNKIATSSSGVTINNHLAVSL
jgi:hypothetical protein